MAQWGKTDVASNSVIWAPSLLKTTANSTTAEALFGNTTANAFVNGITVGVYGVSTAEALSERSRKDAPVTAGWNLRIGGSGGRAGRVSYETLVAMRSIVSDAADDAILEDATITINTQPVADSANSSAGEQGTFNIAAVSVPSNVSLTFQWQGNSSGSFLALTGSGISGESTTTLTLNANTVTQQHIRCVITATGADTVTSSSVLFTVTS
jgi:hypothetical protein